MILVQQKILVVIKRGGRPLLLGMALRAIAGDLRVQGIRGCLVASLALIVGLLLQQGMVESADDLITLDPGMVTVAPETIGALELLVERCFGS